MALAAAAALAAVSAAAASATAPVIVLGGRGFGHGVGMGQFGARGFAEHGATFQQILAHYYPGTKLARLPRPAQLPDVRVLLSDGVAAALVSSATALRFEDAAGRHGTLPAGRYRIAPPLRLPVAGKLRAVRFPLRFEPGLSPLAVDGAAYRGALVVRAAGGGRVTIVNELPLERFLRSVVPAEMPASWPTGALQAQAVAARSYTIATSRQDRPYDLRANIHEAYHGISDERRETNRAIGATAGLVVTWSGRPALAMWDSSSGGRTASAVDVNGGANVPYLVSVADPYDRLSPYHHWQPVGFSPVELGRRLGVGAVRDARTIVNPSGRAVKVLLLTDRGRAEVAATRIQSALGLRSLWFSLGTLSLAAAQPVRTLAGRRHVVLHGVARALDDIRLEWKRGARPWQQTAALTPAADGRLSLLVDPPVTTAYRLAVGSIRTPAVRVVVAQHAPARPSAPPRR